MNNYIAYLISHWQPLSGLVVGLLMVGLYLYLYAKRNAKIIPWIAKSVFRNELMSEKSAENLFMVVTSFLFTIGGLWVILAIYYLTY